MTESKLLAEDRQVVVPGQQVAEGMEYLPGNGTYRQEDKILVDQLGVLNVAGKVLKVTPLASPYLPSVNDVVIGKVVDILMSGWRVDINSPYVSVLPLAEASFDYIKKGADLTEYFELDDYIVCKITQVTSQNLVDITMKAPGLKKLKGGYYVTVNPAKVPRIIGRKGSMVSMLKHATECEIVVGQNGVVWIKGDTEHEMIAVTAIHTIDEQAHISGLTEKIKTFLEEATGKQLNLEEIQQAAEREQAELRNSMPPPRRFDRNDDRRRPPRRHFRGPPREGGFKR